MVNIFNLFQSENISKSYEKFLEGDFKKEARAYSRFIKYYTTKQIEAKKIKEHIQSSKFDKEFYEYLPRIKTTNIKTLRALNTIVLDVDNEFKATESFFYKLLKQKVQDDGIKELEAESRSEYYKQLKFRVTKINETLNIIATIIQMETKLCNKLISQKAKQIDTTDIGTLMNYFYEEEIKNKELIDSLFVVMRYLKSIEEKTKITETDDKLKRVRFVKTYFNSSDFKEFYDNVFVKRFPDPNEQVPYSIINGFLPQKLIAKEYYRCIVAKVNDKVVGGIIYSLFNQGNFTIGIIYWNCVTNDMKEYGVKYVGSRLTNACIDDLKNSSSMFGSSIRGLLAEINDPAKMTQEDLNNETMDPNKRIEFWKRVGFKKLFKGYVQLTEYPDSYVYYASLWIIPFCNEWNDGLTKEDLYKVLVAIGTTGCGYKLDFLNRYKPWLDMMKSLNEKDYYKLE